MNYRFATEKRALDKLMALSPSAQWAFYDLFEQVARHPFVEPDLVMGGSEGAPPSIRVFNDKLIFYSVDHAARRVLILDFEVVDDTS